MRFLKFIGVRIVLSLLLGNMAMELISPDYKLNVLTFGGLVLFSFLAYYGLTLYVNNRSKL